MKLFACQHCGQPLYFENTRCESCGHSLGYLPPKETVTALEQIDGGWRALAEPAGRYRSCANTVHGVCNWLIEADSPEQYCQACRYNRTIPDLSFQQNLQNWRKVETAKHRLFYTLLRLNLPLVGRTEDPERGLGFDFLVATGGPVMTGHDNGLITINLAEADDALRERARQNLAEPYRTLLGHFRHEIAHYYWDRLIVHSPKLEQFRAVFGDERRDYGAARRANYTEGPALDWQERYVTSYASSHPWEDFAETWAHYLHMVDTLETASAFGIGIRPRMANSDNNLATVVDFDPHHADMERIVASWLPLTFAMNSINRSMGQPDLYPFVLGPAVIVKLSFIHDCLREAGGKPVPSSERNALRAVAVSLRRPMPPATTPVSNSTN